jgi:hypothetical protein
VGVHLFSPDYGEAGFTRPCPTCGHEYDPGNWYFSRPCPRCGMDPDAESFPEAVQSVVQGLRRRLGLSTERVRGELAGLLGIPPETLEAWERLECSYGDWRRFTEAVRRVLERERV